jgi:hypothetical protein
MNAKKDFKTIPDIKMWIVICGDQEKGLGGKGHASLFFDHDVAILESVQMKKSHYPLVGIFEISSINIFSKIPHYLKI